MKDCPCKTNEAAVWDDPVDRHGAETPVLVCVVVLGFLKADYEDQGETTRMFLRY